MSAKSVVENTTNNGGQNTEDAEKTAAMLKGYSVRYIKDAFKIYAENHPEDIYGFIVTMFTLAKTDPRYAEMVIKCLGGFDAQESKISGSIETTQRTNPLDNLTSEELDHLIKLKESAA